MILADAQPSETENNELSDAQRASLSELSTTLLWLVHPPSVSPRIHIVKKFVICDCETCLRALYNLRCCERLHNVFAVSSVLSSRAHHFAMMQVRYARGSLTDAPRENRVRTKTDELLRKRCVSLLPPSRSRPPPVSGHLLTSSCDYSSFTVSLWTW